MHSYRDCICPWFIVIIDLHFYSRHPAGFLMRGLEMTEMYAKLRSDLEIRPESSQLGAHVVLKDPITRRFYRFTNVQATVLGRLDGRTSIEVIADEASRQHETAVLQQQVHDFVGKLRQLLLLDHAACWSELEKLQKRPGKLLANVLSIKLCAFNPDALLTTLEKRLHHCFGSVCFGLSGTAMAIAVCLSILNWKELSTSLADILSLYSLPLVVAVAFCVMTIHEFAHGLTLKHFGGKVEEMGFLILYFIPGFYCNVSDAWMLPRGQRIWVTLAGGYAQLTLWAGATICWRFLSPETLGSRLCTIAIAFAGVQTLFNFNPLIRLDGYYLLSDILELPNLRQKAHVYIKRKLRKFFWNDTLGPALQRREERVYAVYGVASLLFSGSLLVLMLQRIMAWLVHEFQGWGVLSFMLLLTIPVASRREGPIMHKFVGDMANRVRKAPGRLLVLALVLAGGFLPWQLKVAGDFTIIPVSRIELNPEVEGTVKCILVDEGSRVKAGDVLAELENLDLINEFEETKGELAARRASLNLLVAGSRPEEIEKGRRQIDTKRAELESSLRVQQEKKIVQETIARKTAELEEARRTLERSSLLLKEGLIARNELDRDHTMHEVRQKELSEAEAGLKALEERTDNVWQVKNKELAQAESELKILLAGSRKESIEAMAAEVTKLEEKTKILSRQIEKLHIESPIDGIVTTPHLHNRTGDHLKVGETLCEIVSAGTVVVEMPVPEKEIGDVRTGFPITLKIRGYPQLSFQAHVREISPVAMVSGSERTVVVRGVLDNPTGTLKDGMTGVGKILCGRRTVAELVTRRAIRWLRTEFWEYLP